MVDISLQETSRARYVSIRVTLDLALCGVVNDKHQVSKQVAHIIY